MDKSNAHGRGSPGQVQGGDEVVLDQVKAIAAGVALAQSAVLWPGWDHLAARAPLLRLGITLQNPAPPSLHILLLLVAHFPSPFGPFECCVAVFFSLRLSFASLGVPVRPPPPIAPPERRAEPPELSQLPRRPAFTLAKQQHTTASVALHTRYPDRSPAHSCESTI